MGWNDSLDTKRSSGGPRMSPHALVQEYLNLTEHLYALVTNGHTIRLLRDSSRLIKLSFLEFDLERMFSEDLYADFALFYRLLHATRMPASQDSVAQSILERYYQDAIESGSRIRDGLAAAVAEAMALIANGMLAHPENASLHIQLKEGNLTAKDLHQNLLRWVYRTLFLFVIEERGLNHQPAATTRQREIYRKYYSLQRLRELADRPQLADKRQHDLWRSMHNTLRLYEDGGKGRPLGIEPLGSFLFREEGLHAIFQYQVDNKSLAQALHHLSRFIHPETKTSMRVNYAALDVEEFGSIYESLLELHPFISTEQKPSRFRYRNLNGNDRKTTGSYYTPDCLVQELIKSALDPVLEARLTTEEILALPEDERQKAQAAAILGMKVCDPAVGSGHFLIAAAHRLANRLAEVRSGEESRSPQVIREALRDVVSHCLFGVDINPMSVELCKVSLWMLGLDPGKPLSFLDHHIRCGNSLLGTNPKLIAEGIPQAAYKKLTGDTSESVKWMAGLNRDALKNQDDLFSSLTQPWDRLGNLPAAAAQLDDQSDDTIADRKAKEENYRKMVEGSSYNSARFLADTWCAAFVWPKDSTEYGSELTTQHLRQIEQNPHSVCPALKEKIQNLAQQYQFFHWHLEFPSVFRIPDEDETPDFEDSELSGGFDVVLGNPPWEKIQSEEKQWFATRDSEIAALAGPQRKKVIKELETENPDLFEQWNEQKRMDASLASFLKYSSIFPLTARGKFNLFGVFAELGKKLTGNFGQCGNILPTGIATDDTTKLFFQELVNHSRLVSLFDFENRHALFPKVHRSFKFCLLSTCGQSSSVRNAEFCFFAHENTDIQEKGRKFTLSPSDIKNLNPNSLTCPIFRFQKDALLTLRIHRTVPILINDSSGSTGEWPLTLRRMFNMTDDAALFQPEETPGIPPLYEAKYIHHFDHRWTVDTAQKQQPHTLVSSRYRIAPDHIKDKTKGLTDRQWFVGWRDVTRNTDERTTITSHIPFSGLGDTIYLFYSDGSTPAQLSCLSGILNSFVVDYCSRQKIAGAHLNQFNMKQLPVLPPERLALLCPSDRHATSEEWLFRRIFELVYNAWDFSPFASDAGYDGAAFTRESERRFALRCELDTLLFHLYLPSTETGAWESQSNQSGKIDVLDKSLLESFPTPRDAVSYIMETFPIVKRKDIARTEIKDESGEVIQEGIFETKGRILAIYDEMLQARCEGREWKSSLNPPPSSFRVTHSPRLPDEEREPIDDRATLHLTFLRHFLRQARHEATLELLLETWRLFTNQQINEAEFATLIPEDDFSSYQQNRPATIDAIGFADTLSGLVNQGLLTYDARTTLVTIPEESDLNQVPPHWWTNYDISVALRALAHRPNIEELVSTSSEEKSEEAARIIQLFTAA